MYYYFVNYPIIHKNHYLTHVNTHFFLNQIYCVQKKQGSRFSSASGAGLAMGGSDGAFSSHIRMLCAVAMISK